MSEGVRIVYMCVCVGEVEVRTFRDQDCEGVLIQCSVWLWDAGVESYRVWGS